MQPEECHECSECNKKYSSANSLLNHIRIIHKIQKYKTESSPFQCKFCPNQYVSLHSRWRHQQKCTAAEKFQEQTVEIDKIKIENEILMKENIKKSEELSKKNEEILKLQNKLLKTKRIDNKTFKAVNRILIDRSLRNTNITAPPKDPYNIVPLGNENLPSVLSLYQKKQILNSRLCSLEKIIEIAHCGELNQFKNIIITNLKDNYAYKYDDRLGYFVTVNKTHLLDDVVSHRVTDIEAIYDELQTANKIDEKTKKLIQDFLDRMINDTTPFYDNEIKYDNFKSFKTDRVKILLYNNQDKLTKDIALLISDDV
jgi:hypothetical protein